MKFGELYLSKMIQEYKLFYIDYDFLKGKIKMDSPTFIRKLQSYILRVDSFYNSHKNEKHLIEFCLLNLFAILKITKKYNKNNTTSISEYIHNITVKTDFYKDLINERQNFKWQQSSPRKLCGICYEDDNYIIPLKCNHSICWNCVLKCYINNYNQCGICRLSMNMNPIVLTLEHFTKQSCNPSYLPFISVNKKCICIGIDGLRPDGLLYANTPNINKIIQNGVFNFETKVATDSYSAPSWAAILSGYIQKDTQIHSNEEVEIHDYKWKTSNLFQELNEKHVRTHTFTSTWKGIYSLTQDAYKRNHFDNDFYTQNDIHTIHNTNEFIEKASYHDTFVFMYLFGVDKVGHDTGFSIQSNKYIQYIERLDSYLKVLLETAKQNNYSIIITTDHGGTKHQDLTSSQKEKFTEGPLKPQLEYNGVHGLDISQHKRTFQIYYGGIVKKESKEWIDELSSTQVYHSILTYMG